MIMWFEGFQAGMFVGPFGRYACLKNGKRKIMKACRLLAGSEIRVGQAAVKEVAGCDPEKPLSDY